MRIIHATTIIARQMRAIVDRLSRQVTRTNCAAAPALPHPDLYGYPPGRSGAAKQRPTKLDPPEQDPAAKAYLPIGPSCC